MVFPRPSDLVDKLLTLFLKLVLLILSRILYIIKGEDVKVTKVTVTVKKADKEKQYTHIIDASKERAINPNVELEPKHVTGILSDTNAEEETEPEPNLITATPSELKPEGIIKDDIISDDDDDKSEGYISDSSIESSSEVQEREIPHIEINHPFEMKTSHSNNNESDVLPFKFCWKHGGQEVIVTGDFDNWQGTHKMVFNSATKNFVADINIDPSKQHEFKFIVDGNWQPNWDLPTRTDEHGHVNNIIYPLPSPLSPEEYSTPFSQFSQLTAAY